MSNLSVEESRAKLKAQFTTYSGEKYTDGWADLWAKGDFLPWDRGISSPALEDTLVNGRDALGSPLIDDKSVKRRKRALVPGCGRGVDVLLLASFGYDAFGLEVAPGAVAACQAFAEENASKYESRCDEGKGSVTFVQGDFYKGDWLGGVGLGPDDKFELIYDYTVSTYV